MLPKKKGNTYDQNIDCFDQPNADNIGVQGFLEKRENLKEDDDI